MTQFAQQQPSQPSSCSTARSSESETLLQLHAKEPTNNDFSTFSSSSSPIPMSAGGMSLSSSSSPYPTTDSSTNFSLLFNSIWTPNQDFTQQQSNPNANAGSSSSDQGRSDIWK